MEKAERMTNTEVVNRCLKAINSKKKLNKKDIEAFNYFLCQNNIKFREKLIELMSKHIAKHLLNTPNVKWFSLKQPRKDGE